MFHNLIINLYSIIKDIISYFANNKDFANLK